MQVEATNRAEKPHKETIDGGGDGGRAIALRSELARKIAAHIQVEGDQVTSVPGLVLFRRTALTSCYSATYEPSIIVYGRVKSMSTSGARCMCVTSPRYNSPLSTCRSSAR